MQYVKIIDTFNSVHFFVLFQSLNLSSGILCPVEEMWNDFLQCWMNFVQILYFVCAVNCKQN